MRPYRRGSRGALTTFYGVGRRYASCTSGSGSAGGTATISRMKASVLLCVLFLADAPGVYAQAFEVAAASIADEQKAMTEGRVTSKAVVAAHLGRTPASDRA